MISPKVSSLLRVTARAFMTRTSYLYRAETLASAYHSHRPSFPTVPTLREWLRSRFGWCPEPLGELATLKSVLWLLGDDMPPPEPFWSCSLDDRPIPRNQPVKRSLDVATMARMRNDGLSYSAIAKLAGVSKERVRVLLMEVEKCPSP